jgi:hypothetical protein
VPDVLIFAFMAVGSIAVVGSDHAHVTEANHMGGVACHVEQPGSH